VERRSLRLELGVSPRMTCEFRNELRVERFLFLAALCLNYRRNGLRDGMRGQVRTTVLFLELVDPVAGRSSDKVAGRQMLRKLFHEGLFRSL
jgi:hypothetical protein